MNGEQIQSAERPREAAPIGRPDLSVVIVNYNVREFLEQALRAVYRASAGLAAEVYVVDNNSADGSVEMVAEQFPGVRLIANDDNPGFGAANNQALREAQGRYVLILNPDTIVQEDTFQRLVAFMDARPEAGAVGCRILNPDGSFALESRRTYPTPAVAFYRISGLSRLFPRSRTFGRYNLTYLPEHETAEVDALSGSCMMVRRAVLYYSRAEAEALAARGLDPDALGPAAPGAGGAGGFDEDFFMYGEDLDWCYRIKAAGWKIYYTPDTEIIHYKGECTKKGELRYVRLFYGAMLRFTEKHVEGKYSQVFAALIRLAIVARAALTLGGALARRLWPAALDFGLALLAASAAGLLRAAPLSSGPSERFFLLLPPLCGAATVAGVALARGYRFAYRYRLRPAASGVLVGLVAVSAASFFIKAIAFSRAVVLLTFVLAGLALACWRLAARGRRAAPRRAILIGYAAEAERLGAMLGRLQDAPFVLVGYVPPEGGAPAPRPAPGAPVRLGALRQIRDIARLQRAGEVIFASRECSNTMVFRVMRQLQDLPVQFKMLAETGAHLIGKASIESLAAPSLVEADAAAARLRTPAARRAFELGVSLAGLAAAPLLHLGAAASGRPGLRALARLGYAMRRVATGERALIGYLPGEEAPPEDCGLRPALFSVRELLAGRFATGDDAESVYWLYARSQSAALDWSILGRALRRAARDPA